MRPKSAYEDRAKPCYCFFSSLSLNMNPVKISMLDFMRGWCFKKIQRCMLPVPVFIKLPMLVSTSKSAILDADENVKQSSLLQWLYKVNHIEGGEIHKGENTGLHIGTLAVVLSPWWKNIFNTVNWRKIKSSKLLHYRGEWIEYIFQASMFV